MVALGKNDIGAITLKSNVDDERNLRAERPSQTRPLPLAFEGGDLEDRLNGSAPRRA